MILPFYLQGYAKRNESVRSHKDKCSRQLFNNSQNLKTIQISINRLINKQVLYIHMMQYHSATKIMKYLYMPGHTWINLKIMLSKRSLTQKSIHLHHAIYIKCKLIYSDQKTDQRWPEARSRRDRPQRCMRKFGGKDDDGNILYLDYGGGLNYQK